MTDTNRGVILRAGLTYTICNVILRGINFFTIPLFIRLLTPEEFGRCNIFLSFESVLYIFSGLAMHASIKNAYYDQKDNYDSFIKNCIYLDFFNSLIILLIANILCLFWSKEIDLNFYEVNLLTLAGFCSAVIYVYSSKLVMEYKADSFALVSFLTVIVGIVLSLYFILYIFVDDHYFGRILGAVLGQVIATVYILWKIFHTGFCKVNISQWKYGLKISLPIVPHGLSQVILSSANRVMIKYIYSTAQAGIFSFTYIVSLVPQVLFQSVSSIWEPWFFEQMSKNNIDQIRRTSKVYCLSISVVFIMMSCIVPEFVRIMATEEYEDAIDLSIIVLMGCYFATLYTIPCEVEYYYKKTLHIATSTIVCAIFNIILNLVLMKIFSYKVAAFTTLIAYFLYFLFHMYMSYIIGGRWIVDVRKMTLIIVVTLLLFILSLLLIDYLYIRLSILLFIIVFMLLQWKKIVLLIKR